MNDRELRTIKTLAEAWTAEDLLVLGVSGIQIRNQHGLWWWRRRNGPVDLLASRVCADLPVFTIDTDLPISRNL